MEKNRHSASFRDPSGYIEVVDGEILRHINPVYFAQYHKIKAAGFFDKLFDNKLLVPHKEIDASAEHILLKPEAVPFITYPYEWSFSQYKHAALHTLKLQKYCLQHGFSLKDATAFNIAFNNGAPVFIDTLSIEDYTEGQPWRAYKQFLMHFLGPLVLAKYFGNDMLKTLQQYIDGMPLHKVVALLPFTARFNALLYTSLYLTAKYDDKYSAESKGHKDSTSKSAVSKTAQLKIIDALYGYIKDLKIKEKTEWNNYYLVTNYDQAAFEHKKGLVKNWVNKIQAKKIIDHGGNDGTFSREVMAGSDLVLTTDIDANAVNQNYLKVLENKERNIYPVVSDMMNPAPAIGFANNERQSLEERIIAKQFDASLALALIHHISLSGNVPFLMSAAYFSKLSRYLIIEFPDRDDSWVSFLLDSKREFKGHFDYYNFANFEQDYQQYFTLKEKEVIPGTSRTLYLFERK